MSLAGAVLYGEAGKNRRGLADGSIYTLPAISNAASGSSAQGKVTIV